MNDGVMNWWQRPDLQYVNGQLTFAGYDVSTLAKRFGTPSFIYSASRFKNNLQRLHEALDGVGLIDHTLYYAMKANRFAPVLTMLKQSGLCGIDACSPNEVVHALGCGFLPEEISFTAGSLSTNDFATLSRIDGLLMNCDSLHAIKQWGALKPGTQIGIRINPATGTARGDNDKLLYAGEKTTKFGIFREQFEQALQLARQYNLTVSRLHFHTGCGFLTPQLPLLEQVLEASNWFVNKAGTIERINIGGGLGVPHTPYDQPLDLGKWASILAAFCSAKNIRLEVEPGDYIAKDSGLLLLGKTYLETRRDTLFLGADAGFNIAPEPVYYQLPFQPVPLHYHGEALIKHHVVGNINEALDVWAENALLPDMSDHSHIALINAGAYSASMASNHCLRGEFKEFLLF